MAIEITGMNEQMLKTFWRSKLYNSLVGNRLLSAVKVSQTSLGFTTTSWEEYWGDVPPEFEKYVSTLWSAWKAYIASDFSHGRIGRYWQAYARLLSVLSEGQCFRKGRRKEFTSKVLGFENFFLALEESDKPFAAATANFRNPLFLSFVHTGLRKHCRNDPCLLPLVVARCPQEPIPFYHYRKQRLLRNMDKGILYFLPLQIEDRIAGFKGLQALTSSIAEEWDCRIEQRSRLLATKALVPLICTLQKGANLGRKRPLRILDVGSGVGLFTRRLLDTIWGSGVLGERRIELSLLDILPVNPHRYFRNCFASGWLGNVSYISKNYAHWIAQPMAPHARKFDIVLICRLLHNISLFDVSRWRKLGESPILVKNRYGLHAHMSSYYYLLARWLKGSLGGSLRSSMNSTICYPRRVFNPQALTTAQGESVLARLMKKAGNILIEDSDLLPSVLVQHAQHHFLPGTKVFDLSSALRLVTNHVYWITKSPDVLPLKADLIWAG